MDEVQTKICVKDASGTVSDLRPDVFDAHDSLPVPRVLARGRVLPRLVIVVNRQHIRSRMSAAEAQSVFDLVEASAELLDVAGADAIEVTKKRVEQGNVDGLVLIGGYDVLRSERVDVLSPNLRSSLPRSHANFDPDGFVVWCDDCYADPTNIGLPAVPISRIPHSGNAAHILNMLTAASGTVGRRFGIRNAQRPFADAVFALLPGSDRLLLSGPHRTTSGDRISLDAANTYMMLHGSQDDGTCFWGEDHGPIEALRLDQLTNDCGGVFFAGCCWGALTVNQIASRAAGGITARTSGSSLAMSFLGAGGLAFIGTTGAHYSPSSSGGYFGGPMHESFWKAIASGFSASEALFAARMDYLRNMPHGMILPMHVAIGMKTFKQFTCLGLGW